MFNGVQLESSITPRPEICEQLIAPARTVIEGERWIQPLDIGTSTLDEYSIADIDESTGCFAGDWLAKDFYLGNLDLVKRPTGDSDRSSHASYIVRRCIKATEGGAGRYGRNVDLNLGRSRCACGTYRDDPARTCAGGHLKSSAANSRTGRHTDVRLIRRSGPAYARRNVDANGLWRGDDAVRGSKIELGPSNSERRKSAEAAGYGSRRSHGDGLRIRRTSQ